MYSQFDPRHRVRARSETVDIAASFSRALGTKRPARDAADNRVLKFLLDLANKPGPRREGELLSKINRMSHVSDFCRSELVMALKGEASYGGLGHVARFRIRNCGRRVERVMVGHIDHPYSSSYGRREQDGTGFVEGTTSERQFLTQDLQPGESVLLDVHWTLVALLAASGQANTPDFWGETGALPPDNLAEVGWKIALFDASVSALRTAESDSWKLGASALPWVPDEAALDGIEAPTVATGSVTNDPFQALDGITLAEPPPEAAGAQVSMDPAGIEVVRRARR